MNMRIVGAIGFAAIAVSGIASVNPATEWAREEFTNYTARIFGSVPEVEFVLPGETSDFADDFRQLKDTDGYAVRRRNGKIVFIADNPKGHVNGVHRWLERNSDIIWPRPKDDLCFFTLKSMDDPSVDCSYLDVPTFRLRIFGGGSGSAKPNVKRYLVRNCSTCPVGVTVGEPADAEAHRLGCQGSFCDMTRQGHDMETRWFPRKEYFADHPEYWMLVDGRRWTGQRSNFCETNSGFIEAFSRSVEQKIRGLPASVKIVSINMEDTSITCQCENCMKPIRLDDGSVVAPDDPAFRSTRFFMFFNKVAEHVEKVRPGTTLLQFAYLHLAVPPKVKVARNIELKFCPYPRNMREGVFGGSSNAKWAERVEGWLTNTPNLYWREYYFCGCIFYPRPIADTAAADLRYIASRGVRDVYTDSPGTGGDDNRVQTMYGLNRPFHEYFDMNAMESWVIQKLFWNPAQDPKRLRAEFLRRTFGPAASDVTEFHRLLDAAWYSDSEPSSFCDDPRRSAAHYIVGKGIAERCRKALASAEAKADNAGRRDWIKSMREVLEVWIREASNYASVEFRVPMASSSSAAAVFPRLKPFKGTKIIDASGSAFSIRSDGRAFVITLDACNGSEPVARTERRSGEPFPRGAKAELFFSVANGYRHFAFDCDGGRYDADNLDPSWNSQWTVSTKKRNDGWTAEVRIPFETLAFEPQKDPQIRFLPLVTLGKGKNLKSYSWLGGVPHTPLSWGVLKVDIE